MYTNFDTFLQANTPHLTHNNPNKRNMDVSDKIAKELKKKKKKRKKELYLPSVVRVENAFDYQTHQTVDQVKTLK